MPDSTKLRAFYRSAGGAVTRPDGDQALRDALSDESGVLWVDLVINSEEDAAVLRDVFRFHPLTIEDCVSPHIDPAKIDDHGEYLFIVVQALDVATTDGLLVASEVQFYLGANYVVSCHHGPEAAIDHYWERCATDEYPLKHAADWVLHGILDSVVDEYLPVVDSIDETIDQLEESVLHNPDGRILQQIMMVKRNALRLRRAATPQRDIMNRLSRGEYPKLVREETAIYYRDIYDHLVRVEYLIEALRDLADGALNTYLSVVSNRLNEVMKALTVAATIFLPLTLVASVYGMNLTPGFWPPSDSDWGFAGVVAGMVAISLGLLAYFRHRRWV